MPQPPLLYVNYANIIETEPQFPGFEEEGPEPSLIEMVRSYYMAGLPEADPAFIDGLVADYFDMLRRA